ncbi:MAG: PAS domain-containing sensor histidine kinase [Salinivirgaceae bacterium]|jgi:signal transduction histidine kinase|nr:PAS domain-containing sensor histidine kinase [Salinivirgaceae bacterium]
MIAINFIHNSIFLTFLGLAIYVLYKNKTVLVNQMVFGLLLFFSLWSLSLFFIQNPLIDTKTSVVFVQIGNLASIGYGIFTFLSIVAFTRLVKLNKLIYVLFAVYFTAVMVFQLATDFISITIKDNPYYPVIEYNNMGVYIIISLVHNLLILSSFILLLKFIRGNIDFIQKRQCIIILITGLISYILASINLFLLTLFPQLQIPFLADLCMIIFAIGLVYSIVKYGLFDIAPNIILKQIIDLLPVGLIIIDIHGQIVRINKALLEITQRKRSEFESKDIKNIISLLTGKTIQLTEKAHFIEKLNVEVAEKQTKQALLHFRKIVDSYGRHIGGILLIQDIEQLYFTQRKLEELNQSLERRIEERTEELLLEKENAEESSRLKTAFLHNISHEIRTPLNAISGFSGLLNNSNLSEEKRKTFVSIIQNSSNKLASIVTDILTISSLETRRMKSNIVKVCVNSIIRGLLVTFKQQAIKKNISLSAKPQLTDEQSEVLTDKTKLIQILTNLIINALKFTQEGFVEFAYNLIDNNLEFYVKDSGIGIAPQFHQKIFERFGKVDTSNTKFYGGTGIGLSISKEYAELLGGKIWVRSEVDKGSIFIFTIPYKL